MVARLLELPAPPEPADVADALANRDLPPAHRGDLGPSARDRPVGWPLFRLVRIKSNTSMRRRWLKYILQAAFLGAVAAAGQTVHEVKPVAAAHGQLRRRSSSTGTRDVPGRSTPFPWTMPVIPTSRDVGNSVDSGDGDEYSQDFTMSDANRQKIFDLAKRADYFQGNLEAKQKNIARTGEKTLEYHGEWRPRNHLGDLQLFSRSECRRTDSDLPGHRDDRRFWPKADLRLPFQQAWVSMPVCTRCKICRPAILSRNCRQLSRFCRRSPPTRHDAYQPGGCEAATEIDRANRYPRSVQHRSPDGFERCEADYSGKAKLLSPLSPIPATYHQKGV